MNVNYGAEALERAPMVAWDVTPPKDLKAQAEALSAAAKAIIDLRSAYQGTGKEPDEEQIAVQFAIPIKGDNDGDTTPEEGADDDVEIDWDDEFEEAA